MSTITNNNKAYASITITDITDGVNGRGISSITNYYRATNTNTKPIVDSSWGTTLPSISSTTPYLWNFERITFSDNSYNDTEVTLLSSTPRAIEQITEYYAVTNGINAPISNIILGNNNNSIDSIPDIWVTTKPEINAGQSLWNCEIIKYSAVDDEGKNLY